MDNYASSLRHLLPCLFFSLVALFLAVSCSKDDAAQTPSSVPVEDILSKGGYWQEDVRFVYLEDGRTRVSENDIIGDFYAWGIADGNPYPDDVLMGPYFHIDPVYPYSVRSYKGSLWLKPPVEPTYYQPDEFLIRVNDAYLVTNVATLSVENPNLIQRNAMLQRHSRIVSATMDRIELEVLISPFIYDNWQLNSWDGYGDTPRRNYLHLQVIWSRITDSDLLKKLENAPSYEAYRKNREK